MKLKNADILLSTTDQFISRAIRFMLRRKDDKAPFSHIGGYVDGLGVVEALHKVVVTAYNRFAKKNKRHMVARHKGLTDEQRFKIAQECAQQIGASYGYLKVFLLQPLDQVFRTNFFTKRLKVTKKPYCSMLWAHSYFKHAEIKINGVHPESCEPDDFHDEITNHPEDWEIIHS
jgi:uncharacterized protein YycO